MKLRINYRLYSDIFYERKTVEVSDEIDIVDVILQQCKFEIQAELGKLIASIYIDKTDIKKYKLQ